MKIGRKNLAAALLTALAVLALAGCDNPSGTPTAEETFRVRFNVEGGTFVPNQDVAKDGRALKPTDPEFGGRSLIGWYTEADALHRWDFNSPVTGDLTLYARWTETAVEAGTWELSFNSLGGPAVAPVLVPDGETAQAPADPRRPGFQFDGWFKEAACETLWDFDTDTVTTHAILYAKWAAENFTAHFDPQGGTPVPPDQSVEKGGRATQPTVTRDGFILKDWGLAPADGPAWDFALDTVEADLTLYARWTELAADEAAVTFNANEGAPVPVPQIVALGGKVVLPGAPGQSGFEFDGWFKDQACLSPWDFDTDTVEEAVTLYAKWTALYTLVFDTQGGSDVAGATLRSGSKAQKPDDPVRGTDRFEGWHDSLTGDLWNFDNFVMRNLSLYAEWTVTTLYTVSLDFRNGSPLQKIEGVAHGGTIAAPVAPTMDKNTFAGWHKEESYTNPWDFDHDTVVADITLYARWTAAVRFDANGGAPALTTQTVTSGSRAQRPGAPTLDGWSFAGWHKELAGTNRWDFALDTVTGDMTLYAKWEIIPATGINNVPVDGLINETLDLDDVVVIPPNASVKDIVWTVKSAGTTGVDPATVDGPFTPTAAGTLVLTATVLKGGADGGDYTENFDIKITAIREVTDIVNVPTDAFVDLDVDLSGATVLPANATNKIIVWTVKTPGAGVSAISGNVFKPTAVGTLVLTASIANGREDEAGNLSAYTQDFTITVSVPESKPGNVGLGEDTTIKLYAGTGTTPLPADSVVTVAKDSTYFVRILTAYTNIVWRLNGTKSTATGNRLYLDTGKVGTVKLTVEAESNGVVDSGTYVFKIE